MRTPLLLLLAFVISGEFAVAQDSDPLSRKGSFYFNWGYNRSFFSTSDLHFNGPEYDFTLYNVSASDRPTKFGLVYLNPTTLTVPQFNVRAGYFMTDRWAISVGMDHLKYVLDQGQTARISGVITEEASSKYAGVYLNEEITIDRDLLRYEHSDGLNLVSVDVEYLLPIYDRTKSRLSIFLNGGIGGIWVVTKTNVRVFGDGLDNDFHVAGFNMHAKLGPRLEWKKKLFLGFECKGGYASLPSVLIKNAAPEIGDQNFSFFAYSCVLGFNFRFGREKE